MHYEERLPCGGALKIYQNKWEIKYYFSGPDLRYNGTFVTIPGEKIDEYIAAYRENFAEFLNLKQANPMDKVDKPGKMGMRIRVKDYFEGVCVGSYHMPIANQEKLEKLISGYRHAESRVNFVQAFLKSLDAPTTKA